MQLQLQTFSSLVSVGAAAVQGSARQLIDLTVGSTLRAVLEASASVGLWMQWLILQVLQMTRAATSAGADLDSWVADFGLVRLPPVAATGTVTLSRFTALSTALVPVGTELRTGDASQSFTVVADPSNSAWSAPQNGYTMGETLATLTVPVVATVAGSASNVQAGAISLIAAALPGIDTVVNTSAVQGGVNAESDQALRGRFQDFINSRSRATPVAIGYAVASVQQGLQYTLAENRMPDGTSWPGFFTLTVDDGSGAPSATLLATVTAAVEAVRPVGSIFSVRGPAVVQAQISLAVDVAAPTSGSAVRQAVTAALVRYTNSLPIGARLAWSRLMQLAYAAHPAVINVRTVSLNGGESDLDPGVAAVVKASSVTVS